MFRIIVPRNRDKTVPQRILEFSNSSTFCLISFLVVFATILISFFQTYSNVWIVPNGVCGTATASGKSVVPIMCFWVLFLRR